MSAPPPLAGTTGVREPLSLTSTFMRNPELWMGQAQGLECAEEGDLLHPVLSQTQLMSDGALPGGCHPVLTFPASERPHLAGEYAKAYFSFRNVSPVALSRLRIKIEITSPSGRQAQLAYTEVTRLDPNVNKDITVEHWLQEPSTHTINVVANYNDVSFELRRFAVSIPVKVDRGLEETARHVESLAPTGPNLDRPVYSVSLSVKNCSDVVVFPTLCKFHPTPMYDVIGGPASVMEFNTVSGGGGAEDPVLGHMYPGEVRQYAFRIVAKEGATLPKTSGDLGYAQWDWRRANGDTGAATSLPFVILKPDLLPPVHLTVFKCSPAVAGKPMTLTLRIVNRGSSRLNASLAVRLQALLPDAVYTGPCTRPVDIVEGKGGTTEVELTIIPMVTGVLRLQGAFELRDAFHPDNVVWPVKAVGAAPSVDQRAALTDIMKASQPPPQVFPPVLCEVFVEAPESA